MTMTIEDVRRELGPLYEMRKKRETRAHIGVDRAIEVYELAERALAIPEGLDERALRCIDTVMAEDNPSLRTEKYDWPTHFHTIRALAAENQRLNARLGRADMVLAESYQIVARMLNDMGIHGEPASDRLLDNLIAAQEVETPLHEGTMDVDYPNKRATAAEAEVERLREVLRKLTFTARTAGGWQPDAELMNALDLAEAALTKGPGDA